MCDDGHIFAAYSVLQTIDNPLINACNVTIKVYLSGYFSLSYKYMPTAWRNVGKVVFYFQ